MGIRGCPFVYIVVISAGIADVSGYRRQGALGLGSRFSVFVLVSARIRVYPFLLDPHVGQTSSTKRKVRWVCMNIRGHPFFPVTSDLLMSSAIVKSRGKLEQLSAGFPAVPASVPNSQQGFQQGPRIPAKVLGLATRAPVRLPTWNS